MRTTVVSWLPRPLPASLALPPLLSAPVRDQWSSDPDRTTRAGDTRTPEQLTREVVQAF